MTILPAVKQGARKSLLSRNKIIVSQTKINHRPYSSTATATANTTESARTTSATSSPSEKRDVIDFDDVQSVFKRKPLSYLIQNYGVLSTCQTSLIKNYGAHLFELGGPLAVFFAKHTYFEHFCGGEKTPDLHKVARQLSMEDGVSCIFDYSVEGSPPSDETNTTTSFDESRADRIADVILDNIVYSAKQNEIHKGELQRLTEDNRKYAADVRCSFAVVKLTGLANFSLLQRLSEILCFIAERKLSPEQAKTLLPPSLYVENYQPVRSPAFKVTPETPTPRPLSQGELLQIDRVLERLYRLCDGSRNAKLPLLIDAEQSFVQPVIDLFYMIMCLKYNSESLEDKRPIVYTTYQMYLKDALGRMKYDYEFAKSHGRKLGVKMVRGAYMKTEAARSQQLQIPYCVNDTIKETHKSYNDGIRFGLEKLVLESTEKTGGGILIATHNQGSLTLATNSMAHEYNIPRNDQRVYFGQLYGMGNTLSLGLSTAGFNCSKYVPFGPVNEVMPYLSRRLIENSDIMGASGTEVKRYLQEIKRRLLHKQN